MVGYKDCFNCGAPLESYMAGTCCAISAHYREKRLAGERALAAGALAYRAGLALRDNPWRGREQPGLAGQWTKGWKRERDGDPNAPRTQVIGFRKAKRHAGHAGTKNRI